MREEQKRHELLCWRQLLAAPVVQLDVEDRYYELLRRANVLQKEGLISRLEWRQLVRDAGTVLAKNPAPD